MVTGGDTRDDSAESSNSDDAKSSDKSGSKLRKGNMFTQVEL
jgi:hypothetical protein